MAPVLEQLLGVEHGGQQVAPVRPEPGEHRHLLAADEHVDRVDLDQTDAVEHPAGVTAVDAARRSRLAEALGGERDRACRRRREALHGSGQSDSLIVTELITTSSTGLSPPPVRTFCICSTTSRPFTTLPKSE